MNKDLNNNIPIITKKQENFKLYGEDGELVFDSGELEMATYEAFYENKK